MTEIPMHVPAPEVVPTAPPPTPAPSSGPSIGAVAVPVLAFFVAGVLAAAIAPFEPGHTFGVSLPGYGQIVGGTAWWMALGLLLGVVAGRSEAVPEALAAVPASPSKGRDQLVGAAVGALVTALTWRSFGAALGFGAAVLLVPRVHRRLVARSARLGTDGTPAPALHGALVGFAPGALVAAALPPVACWVLVLGLVGAAGWLWWKGRPPRPHTVALLFVVGLALLALGGGRGASAADSSTTTTTVPKPTTVTDKKVKVASDKAFVDTGVYVSPGQVLTITASGSVSFLGENKAAKADPDGLPARFSGCDAPSFCGVLVGRVAEGAPFLVGSKLSVPITTGGKLQLGVNDFDQSDNSGSFAAVVTVADRSSLASPVFSTGSSSASSSSTPSPDDGPGFGWVLWSGIAAAGGAVVGRRLVL